MPDFVATWPHSGARFVPVNMPGNNQFFLSGVTPTSEKVLGYFGGTPADPSTQGLRDPQVGLLAVGTGQILPLLKLTTTLAQGPFEVDGTTMVWTEASDPAGYDWRILARPMDLSSPVRVLASAAPQPSAAKTPLPQVAPHIDHGVVVWAAAAPGSAAGAAPDVFEANVDGSPPRTLAVNAVGPQISWPLIAYAQVDGSSSHTTISVYNVETRQTTTFPDIVDASYWAISSGTLVWVEASRKKLYVRNLSGGKPTLIADVSSSLTNYIQYPSATNRFVAWSAEGGEWIYEMTTGKSVKLNQHPLFDSVYLRWNAVAWPVPIPQTDSTWKPWNGLRGYYIVDTANLT